MATEIGENRGTVAQSPTSALSDPSFEKAGNLEDGQAIHTKVSLARRFWRWCRGPARDKSREKATQQQSEVHEKRTVRTVESGPEGYPQLAIFQSSDHSFMQYRGFAYLHARILLSLQYEIEVLERELDDLDEFESDKRRLQCLERDRSKTSANAADSDSRTRTRVLADIKAKVLDYDEVLLKSKEISSLQRPSNRDWASVKAWMLQNKPLVAREQQFIEKREDIITLRTGRECAGFDGFIEKMLSLTDNFLSGRCGISIIKTLFVTAELRKKTNNCRIHYYAPARVSKLVNFVITAIIFVLLVLPVVAMYELSEVSKRSSPFEAIGILIVFTMLFSAAMSGLTKASRQELFAASAAYCAVLVVFISNFSTQTVAFASGYVSGLPTCL